MAKRNKRKRIKRRKKRSKKRKKRKVRKLMLIGRLMKKNISYLFQKMKNFGNKKVKELHG